VQIKDHSLNGHLSLSPAVFRVELIPYPPMCLYTLVDFCDFFVTTPDPEQNQGIFGKA